MGTRVYLVFDDSRPAWDVVVAIYQNKDEALKCAAIAAGSSYKFISDEERWEGPDCRSVWVDERKVQ